MVDTQTYTFYRDFLFAQSGYVLSQDKSYLLESKLSPIAKKHGAENVIALAQKLSKLPTTPLMQDVVGAMTINETFFFRDNKPFDTLEELVVEKYVKQQDRSRLKYWSAACSSGQEAYSIAMVMEKISKLHRNIHYDIVATDISTEIVKKAQQGIYNDFEVKRGLSDAQIKDYFDQTENGWQIKARLKNHILFKTGNLVRDYYSDGPFDIIFLRNVLIYFDVETKTKVLEKMHRVLGRDGYLVLGAPETVIGLGDYFSPSQRYRGFYTPNH